MRTDKMLIFLMLAAFILRLPLCLQQPDALIPKVVSDDAFYYLCIARNIAAGRGATVDGESPTNGFHPLWALILVPLSFLKGDAGLQAPLILLSLFSALSAWFLYRVMRHSCGEAASLLASLAWLACPYSVLVALAGVEAPLLVLMVGMTSCAYLSLAAPGAPQAPLRRWAAVGLIAGAAVMARIDGAILALLIALDILLDPWRYNGTRGKRTVHALVFAGTCAAVVLPWFLWSYVRTGFIFYTSGKAIYHQQHALFLLGNHGAGVVRYALAWLGESASNARAALRTLALLCGATPLSSGIVLGLFAAAAISVAARNPGLFREWLSRVRRFWFLFAYGAVAFILYCAYLWYSQDWYYYSIVFTACLAGGCVLDLIDGSALLLMRGWLRTGAWTLAGILIAAFSLWRTASLWERGLRGWQSDMYRAALWAGENLPRGARLGSFNSGMLSYYCPQTVINLDGVVNGEAYRAIVEGRIFEYVKREGIGYLVESPISLRFRSVQSQGEAPPPLVQLRAEMSYPEAARRSNPVFVYRIAR